MTDNPATALTSRHNLDFPRSKCRTMTRLSETSFTATVTFGLLTLYFCRQAQPDAQRDPVVSGESHSWNPAIWTHRRHNRDQLLRIPEHRREPVQRRADWFLPFCEHSI